MALCAKVWAGDEPTPPDGQFSNLTTAPPRWFREPPSYAAELYALERWGLSDQKDRLVYVEDDKGGLYSFLINMMRFVDVRVDITPLRDPISTKQAARVLDSSIKPL